MINQHPDIETTVKAIVRFLEKNGQLENLPKIIQELSQNQTDLTVIEIISAIPLEPDQITAVIKKLDLSPTNLQMVKNTVDPKIQAGMIIKINDRVLDLSLKGQIDQLKLKIN